MRFRIEQLYLTDDAGKAIEGEAKALSLSYHILEAASVDEALVQFVEADHASFVGDILKLPGLQAVATVRRNKSVYTLQLLPASDHFQPSR